MGYNPNQPRVPAGNEDGGQWTSVELFRAANDDLIVGTASFAETREAAELYLNNPGFGGRNIYRAVVDVNRHNVLDTTDMSRREFFEHIGMDDPGAIGVDEFVGRGDATDALRDQGVSWVVVRESYPANTRTWVFIGDLDAEPDMEPVDVRVTLSPQQAVTQAIERRRARG